MKKVAVWSNCSLSATGFGVHARILLQWLQDKGYDVIELAAGAHENDAILQMLPWPAFGLSPGSEAERNHIMSQGGAQYMGYGRVLIDKVIKEQKPDVIIAIEDSWAWAGLLDRAIYREMPENWIFWSPVDSTPPLQDQIDFFKTVKNTAVKATFAQKEFKKWGIETEFWPALVDTESMRPNRDAGLELRRKSGISDDTFVSGFVFRNQLRKLVIPQFQALKMFKDKYPDKKAKLIFHTNPFEPDQWNCVRHAELEGLSAEDVYYTRICPVCKDITFGPALVNKVKCSCGRGELQHPSPGNGASEEDKNTIYNSFDVYTHTATSGGFEIPLLEASLVGLPTACPNYSYGEMFVDGAAQALPFTSYNEVKSGYEKAHSTPEGILEFWEKNLDSFDTQGQINWARDFADIDKTCEKVKKVIDSCPQPNYNWEFPCDNPEFPKVETNEDFAAEILYGFFGEVNPKLKDEILGELGKGRSRESIYLHNQSIVKNFKNKIDYKSLFKDDDKKRLLICLEKSLGDLLVLNSVLEELKKKYKDWSIYLLTNSASKQMVEHMDVNIIISDSIPTQILENTLFWEGSTNHEKLVDIYLQPYILTQRFHAWTHNGNSL